MSDDRDKELRRLEALITHAVTSRSQFFNQFLDPRRNINDECGYPDNDFDSYQYQKLYDREAVATRVVEVLPRESWQVQPSVYEDEKVEVSTNFEKAFDEMAHSLRAEPSHYRDESSNPLWEYLLRADILSGVGQYGALFLGFNDGKDYDQPIGPLRINAREPRKLLFVRCFPESLAQISQFDQDPTSQRFGQPLMYSLTFNDPSCNNTGVGLAQTTVEVHWSRVIHLADNLASSEVFGVPRMRPVLNRLLDLQKLYGGSAEMYWRGAFPGLAMETQPSLGGDVEIDRSSTRDMLEEYMNGLQRYLVLYGMSAKTLAPQVVDPTPQITTQIEAICIRLGIPKRVFMGSERGELASSQDAAAWNDRLRERQKNYVTPRIIVPFIDRLINLDVLPVPKSGYKVRWPDMTSQTEMDKAKIALTKTQAMAQYVGSRVQRLLKPIDFITRILGVSDKEAMVVLENLQDKKIYTIPDDAPTSSSKTGPGTNGFNVKQPLDAKDVMD